MDQKILDALKTINEKLGGTNDPNEKWGTLLQEIAENIDGGGGGSSLPSVTSDDNGDVLTVVEGEWAKVEPTSCLPSVTSDDNGDVLTVVEGEWAKAEPSGCALYVHVGWEESLQSAFSDKTYAEIKSAIDAGRVVFVIGHPDTYNVSNLSGIDEINQSIGFIFLEKMDSRLAMYWTVIGYDESQGGDYVEFVTELVPPESGDRPEE